jgi:hypothetical protein
MVTKNNTQNIFTGSHISVSSVFFAALIGLGFAITLASFGGAIVMSLGPANIQKPGAVLSSLIVVAAVLLIITTFFIAGFIASKVSHQKLVFDSITHSLSTWALMSVLIVSVVASAAIGESIRRGLSKIEAPVIVTDMEVFKAKATTAVQSNSKKSDKPNKEDKEANHLLALAWWVAFSSLLLGAGTSVWGGLLGRQRLPIVDS